MVHRSIAVVKPQDIVQIKEKALENKNQGTHLCLKGTPNTPSYFLIPPGPRIHYQCPKGPYQYPKGPYQYPLFSQGSGQRFLPLCITFMIFNDIKRQSSDKGVFDRHQNSVSISACTSLEVVMWKVYIFTYIMNHFSRMRRVRSVSSFDVEGTHFTCIIVTIQ